MGCQSLIGGLYFLLEIVGGMSIFNSKAKGYRYYSSSPKETRLLRGVKLTAKKIIKKTAKKSAKKIPVKTIKDIVNKVHSDLEKKPKKKIKKDSYKNYEWKPGQSGNPGGRPKGTYGVRSFKQILDKIGAEDIHESPFVPPRLARKFNCYSKITMKTGVMRVVYNMALAGKDWATRYIADYSEGKPKEFHEITRKSITVDIEDEQHDNIPIGEDIGNGDDEEIVTASDSG